VLAYKSLALAAQLGNLALIWWLLGRWRALGLTPSSRVAAFAVFAWNPVALLELVGNGHNEALMLLLVLVGLAALTVAAERGWRNGWAWLLALVSLLLGSLVKFVPAAVGGAVALVWLRGLRGARQRVLGGVLLVGLVVGLSALMAWPWLDSWGVWRPLLGIATGGQRFKDGWQDAPAAWLAVRLLPALGVPADPPTVRESVSRTIVWGVTRAAFVVYLAFELRHLWRQSAAELPVALGAAVTSAARALLLAILLFVTQVYPWYFVWPLPLVTLLGWRSLLTRATVVFGVSFLPAYYLREFQSYGVFYLPLYVVAALVVLVATTAATKRLRPVGPSASHP
jgi:hypothetical protein